MHVYYGTALIIVDDGQIINFPPDLLPSLPSAQLADNEPCCTVPESFQAIGYGRRREGGWQTDTLEETTLNFVEIGDCVEQWYDDLNLTLTEEEIESSREVCIFY